MYIGRARLRDALYSLSESISTKNPSSGSFLTTGNTANIWRPVSLTTSQPCVIATSPKRFEYRASHWATAVWYRKASRTSQPCWASKFRSRPARH